MKVGDLVKVMNWQGFENAGKHAIVISKLNPRWWTIVCVDGQKGSVMKHHVEVLNENR